MTRTQIQLPDDVYARVRRICDARETSLAELSRHGIESVIGVYAAEPAIGADWQPPKPCRLGWKGLTDVQIKEQARFTTTEAATRRRKK